MGNYLSVSILMGRMGETVLDNLCRNITGVPKQDAFLEDVVDRAEGLINGYAGRIYEVPMPRSPMLEELACRFAEYEMYKRGSADDVPTKYKITENDWKILMDMSTGIFVPEGAVLRTVEGTSIDAESDTALMSEDAFSEMPSDTDPYDIWWG